MTAVNLNPRVYFSSVWSEEGRPPELDDWTTEQLAIFAAMVGNAPPWEIASAMGASLRAVLWFEHNAVLGGILDDDEAGGEG